MYSSIYKGFCKKVPVLKQTNKQTNKQTEFENYILDIRMHTCVHNITTIINADEPKRVFHSLVPQIWMMHYWSLHSYKEACYAYTGAVRKDTVDNLY